MPVFCEIYGDISKNVAGVVERLDCCFWDYWCNQYFSDNFHVKSQMCRLTVVGNDTLLIAYYFD